MPPSSPLSFVCSLVYVVVPVKTNTIHTSIISSPDRLSLRPSQTPDENYPFQREASRTRSTVLFLLFLGRKVPEVSFIRCTPVFGHVSGTPPLLVSFFLGTDTPVSA